VGDFLSPHDRMNLRMVSPHFRDQYPLHELVQESLHYFSIHQGELTNQVLQEIQGVLGKKTIQVQTFMIADELNRQHSIQIANKICPELTDLRLIGEIDRFHRNHTLDDINNFIFLKRLDLINFTLIFKTASCLQKLIHLKSLNLSGCHISDEGLFSFLPALQTLRSLNLSACTRLQRETATPDNLEQILKSLNSLETVDLSLYTDFQEPLLPSVGGLRNCTSLNVAVSNINDAQLAFALSNILNLRVLDLHSCPSLTSESFVILKTYGQGLRSLNIKGWDPNSRESDLIHQLDQLSSLKGLRELNLSYCKLSSRSLVALGLFDQLTILFFSSVHIKDPHEAERDLTDEEWTYLSPLTKIELLDLELTPITDSGLDYLGIKNMQQLTSLNINNCNQLTHACLDRLRPLKTLRFLRHYNSFSNNQYLETLANFRALEGLWVNAIRLGEDDLLNFVRDRPTLRKLVLEGYYTHLTLSNLSYIRSVLGRGFQISDEGFRDEIPSWFALKPEPK
jgi:hypothetical protein